MARRNLIILAIIIIFAVSLIIRFSSKTSQPLPEPEKKPEDITVEKPVRVVRPLASGEQIYDITGPEDLKFTISQITVDPLDVETGQTQTVTVIVEDLDRTDITEKNRVSGTALTDNETKSFSLKLMEVSETESGLLTVWQSLWQLEDTYDFNYQMVIDVYKEGADDSVTLTFR